MSDQPGNPVPGERGSSFEERLKAARGRQGLNRPIPAGDASKAGGLGQSALGIGLRVGVEMVAAMIVAVAIGWALDRWLHTAPLFIALFVLAGGAAGVLNVWRMFAPKRDVPPRS